MLSKVASLTARECAIMDQVVKGWPTKLIAYEVGWSDATVKVSMRKILVKLGVQNRTQAAVMYALEKERGF